MKVEKLDLPEVLLLKPHVFEDQRGYFFESFNREVFKATTGIDVGFVQDNESQSSGGVLRGLHFQLPPHAQGKLVRVVRGSVYDVAVDIRKNSNTFGQYVGIELSETNKYQLYIPPGFAHGFCVRDEATIFSYKCTAYYNRESERTIRWDDPKINIDWGIKKPLISDKDQNKSVFLNDLKEGF